MKIFLLITILLCISTTAYADQFQVEGYEIDISASRRGTTVSVSGRLRGGEDCKNLRLDIFMHNELGGRAHTVVTLSDVGGYGSKIIEGSDQLILPKGNDWEVSSIYARCVSEREY